VVRGQPVGKPEHDHHDDTDMLPERRRDAFGAHGLIGLPEQPDYGVANFAQGLGSGSACVLVRCQGESYARGLMFQRVGRETDRRHGRDARPAAGGREAFCPS
jgi:hypothetical protein